jgi:hypothetical protein
MGAGHYHIRDGATVYAEPYAGLPEFDESIRWQWDDATHDLKDSIRDSLSPRFDWLEKRGQWRDDALVLAKSRLHDVTLHEDSYGHCYVTVRPRDDLPGEWEGLAAGNLEAVADRLFFRLSATYDLWRGSGWSSSRYETQGLTRQDARV